MRKFFDYENGVWKAIGRLGDLMMLNLVYIICCIPMITLGAAKTALYAETKKMVKNEEGHIIMDFFEKFKENFRASTIMWLIYLIVSILPIMDLIACNYMEQGAFVTFCRAMMILTLIVINLTLIYSLALQSTFENTVKNTIKNGFIMTLGHFPYSILILLVNFSPYLAVLFLTQFLGAELLLIVFVWFAAAAFLNAYIFNHIFDKYIRKEE